MPFDLTTASGTLEYLRNTPFASIDAIPLSGGFANYVWRLSLEKPYDGRSSVILKHAEAFAAGMNHLELSLDRFRFEYLALKVIEEELPFLNPPASSPPSIVHLPKLFYYDEENYVLIVEDAGQAPTLKDFMSKESPPNPDLAAQIGMELGKFFSALHEWGKTDAERLRPLFTNNKTARTICDWRTSGRLLDAAKESGYGEDDRIAKAIEKMSKDVLESEETLTMGDSWPGNVLVSLKDDGALNALFIVDWELVKYGPAATDVGQFGAEAWCIARFRDAKAGKALISSFYDAYVDQKSSFNTSEVSLYLASHIAVWTPIAQWGKKEEVTRAVKENLEYLGDAWDGWIKGGEVARYVDP